MSDVNVHPVIHHSIHNLIDDCLPAPNTCMQGLYMHPTIISYRQVAIDLALGMQYCIVQSCIQEFIILRILLMQYYELLMHPNAPAH